MQQDSSTYYQLNFNSAPVECEITTRVRKYQYTVDIINVIQRYTAYFLYTAYFSTHVLRFFFNSIHAVKFPFPHFPPMHFPVLHFQSCNFRSRIFWSCIFLLWKFGPSFSSYVGWSLIYLVPHLSLAFSVDPLIGVNERTVDGQINDGRTAGRPTGIHNAFRCLLLAVKA